MSENIETQGELETSPVSAQAEHSKPKNNKPLIIGLSFVLVAALAVVAFFGYKAYVNYDLTTQWKVLEKELTKINETGTVDQTIRSTGKIAELEKYIKTQFSEFLTKQNSYVADVSSVSGEFSPESLAADDASLTKHKQSLANVRVSSTAFYTSALKFFDSAVWEKEIRSLKLPTSLTNQIVSEINKEFVPFHDKIAKAQEIDKKLWDEYEVILTFLVENKSSWTVENNKLTFTDQVALDAYNTHITNFGKYAQELANSLQ